MVSKLDGVSMRLDLTDEVCLGGESKGLVAAFLGGGGCGGKKVRIEMSRDALHRYRVSRGEDPPIIGSPACINPTCGVGLTNLNSLTGLLELLR